MASAPLSNGPAEDFAWPFPESRLLRFPVFRGLGREELVQAVEMAAEAGFNGILAPLTVGGLPVFPSEGPQRYGLKASIPEFHRRDVLGEISAAARKAGLRLYVGIQPWRPTGDPSARTILQWFHRRRDWFSRRPQALRRRHAAVHGKQTDLAFCPTNAVRRRYVGDLLSEAIEGYPVAGLLFDAVIPAYSLAPGQERCFCPSCARDALENANLDLTRLVAEPPPADAVEAWKAWQVGVIHSMMGYFSQRCHKARRRLLMYCRAQATREAEENEPPGSDPFAPNSVQSWRPWLQMGGIDGLALEGFPDDAEGFAGAIEHNLASWPDDALLHVALSASDPTALAAQLDLLRHYPLAGCLVEWSGALSAVAVKQLSATCFAPPVFVAEDDLPRSVGLLFAEVARLAPADSGVSEFLTALLAFVREPKSATEFQALESMVENVRGLEARILGGQISFGEQERLVLCRLSQAKRLARLASHYGEI